MSEAWLRIGVGIIWRDGRILVAQRLDSASHAAGLYEFPGGKCEANESFAECAVREIEEETALQVLAGAPYEIIEWHYAERSVQIAAFDCEIIAGTARALESAAILWQAPHELEAAKFPAANATLIAQIQARHG